MSLAGAEASRRGRGLEFLDVGGDIAAALAAGSSFGRRFRRDRVAVVSLASSSR